MGLGMGIHLCKYAMLNSLPAIGVVLWLFYKQFGPRLGQTKHWT